MKYIPQLDGLRGLAILIVMAVHVESSYFTSGFIGVDIFFVLSGFLITSILIKEYDQNATFSLKSFYKRRLLRLGPALILCLLVFTLVSIFVLNKEKMWSNIIDAGITLIYMSNWARAFSIHPPDYLGHTWSLSIEEQFYIFWPFILLLLLKTITNRWTVTCMVFMLALSSWFLRWYLIEHDTHIVRLFNGLDTRADALMIGCALGVMSASNILSEKMKTNLAQWLPYLSGLALIGIFIVSFDKNWASTSMYVWGFFCINVLTAIVILQLTINKHSLLHNIFATKWLVWIGSISYGLYLWHYLVFRVMMNLQFSKLEIALYGSLITIAIATGSYYWLEKPLLLRNHQKVGS